MHVTLVHNPGSGERALTGPDLIAAARDAGHHVSYAAVTDRPAVAALLSDPGDLVAIVGGDGTMRSIATRMIGRGIPLTLVPTGTANNIGSALGITGEAKELIAGWRDGLVLPFDAGIVRGSRRPCPMLEGMGFGPIAGTIAALSPLSDAEAHAAWTVDEVRRDVKVLREVLADCPVHQCHLTLDGRDLSGEYLLVEVLNVGAVGPNVELAPEASVSDGLFDVVALYDADRAVLRDYLTARLDGAAPTLRVPVQRGRHVQMRWRGSRVHIDDQIWPDEREASNQRIWSRDGQVTLEVLMNPAALQILVPPADRGTRLSTAAVTAWPA